MFQNFTIWDSNRHSDKKFQKNYVLAPKFKFLKKVNKQLTNVNKQLKYVKLLFQLKITWLPIKMVLSPVWHAEKVWRIRKVPKDITWSSIWTTNLFGAIFANKPSKMPWVWKHIKESFMISDNNSFNPEQTKIFENSA